MNNSELITRIIALAGLGLSIYQEIRNSLKEKRKLKITLIWVKYQETFKIHIVNIRKRPIFIRDIGLSLYTKDKHFFQIIPRNSLFIDPEIEFPIELGDGQSAEFVLTDAIRDDLLTEKYILNIQVIDSDMNVHNENGTKPKIKNTALLVFFEKYLQ